MRREVEPRIREIEEKKPGVMRAVLEKAGAIGLLGHDVPEEYGGLGGDKTSSSLIFESASRLGSFAVSYGAHVGIGTMPLVLFGTAEQKRRYLPSLASGERIAAYALTEPGSGSDALGAKTRAVLTPDGKSWKLTGTKQYITNAGFADLFTVFAKVDGEKFTAFLVERSAPGLTIGPEEHKLGIRGSSTCPLYPRGLHDPGRQRARRHRRRPQDRVQHPEHRALEAGRGRGGRREVLPGDRREVRARAQAVRQADRRLRSHPQEDRRHRHADLRRRVDGVPHRGPARRAQPRHRSRGSRRRRRSRSTRSRSTRSRRRSSRSSGRRCCTSRRTRRCRSSAAPATSRTIPSSA